MTVPNEQAISSVLISLIGKTLILPASAIVDVTVMEMPQVTTKMPNWFIGYFPWKGLRIPFISFEAMTGEPFKITTVSNVAILKLTTDKLNTEFFALLIQNKPTPISITENNIVTEESEVSPFELTSVHIKEQNIKAVIPNMPAVEKRMIEIDVLT